MMKPLEKHYFDCECSDLGHTLRFWCDPEFGSISVEFRLVDSLPWYKRLVRAVYYVLGRQLSGTDYDSTMLRQEDYVRLLHLMSRALCRQLELEEKT